MAIDAIPLFCYIRSIMKPKLFIILLLLIVVPAIFLSVMAARALYDWDTILQKRLQAQAYTAACSVKDRTDAALQGELEEITSTIKAIHDRGSSSLQISKAAKELELSSKLIKDVYVFMNPWDFLYPLADKRSPEEEQVMLTLRGKIATATSPAEPLCFNIDDASYDFGLVSMQGLYAGYEIVTGEVFDILQAALKKSADELIIYAEGNDLFIMPDKQINIVGAKHIMIEDPFGKEDKPPYETVIAQVKLHAPFDYIVIKAKIRDEARLREIATTRRSVYGWVILLLVFGITAGVIIVWRSAIIEIKKARIRSTYVAGISHDLRTPLASMQMLTETLLRGKITDSTKQKKFLETIFRESERLSQLVERVLFFVRYGQGALVFKVEPVDIPSLINEAVKIIGDRLCISGEPHSYSDDNKSTDLIYTHDFKLTDTSTVRISVHLEEDLPPVQLDLAAVTQVMLNLLDNAVKYSSTVTEQDREIKIDLKARLCSKKIICFKKEWLIIDIHDYGLGIEKKSQKKIFERFYRSPRAVDHNVSGVGLGLSLCKHIVKAHSGKITVVSKLNEGSTFSVYLPVLRPQIKRIKVD